MRRTTKYLLIGVGASLSNLTIQIIFRTYLKVREDKIWSAADANQTTTMNAPLVRRHSMTHGATASTKPARQYQPPSRRGWQNPVNYLRGGGEQYKPTSDSDYGPPEKDKPPFNRAEYDQARRDYIMGRRDTHPDHFNPPY